MADEADVGNALVAIVAAAAYPDGTSQPSALGAPVTIQRGWPLPADLDDALKAGKITISIFGDNGSENNVTRFSRDWQQLVAPNTTLTLSFTGANLVISGPVAMPQNVAITVGDFPATSVKVIYAVQAGDTLTTIATGLASLLVTAGVPVTSSGATIIFDPTAIVTALAGGYGTIVRELKRQERTFTMTLWCNSSDQRDLAAPVIDIALARPENLRFADGTVGRMVYQRSLVLDEKQTLAIYRRDIQYRIEYATIETAPATEILAIPVSITSHY